MNPKGRISNGPGYLPHQNTSAEQDQLDEVYRHRMIRVVIRNASDADDLVLLTAALELDQELDELATTPERQRLISAARERLAETVGSPADL